jgi:hypothetical protein
MPTVIAAYLHSDYRIRNSMIKHEHINKSVYSVTDKERSRTVFSHICTSNNENNRAFIIYKTFIKHSVAEVVFIAHRKSFPLSQRINYVPSTEKSFKPNFV